MFLSVMAVLQQYISGPTISPEFQTTLNPDSYDLELLKKVVFYLLTTSFLKPPSDFFSSQSTEIILVMVSKDFCL